MSSTPISQFLLTTLHIGVLAGMYLLGKHAGQKSMTPIMPVHLRSHELDTQEEDSYRTERRVKYLMEYYGIH